MKISLNWLNRYIDLGDKSADELQRVLPMIGHEVEAVTVRGAVPQEHLVVGEVLDRQPHPNADKLGVCQVLVASGAEPQQIVCGASNYRVGDRIPVALPGCVLPGDFAIKASQLRGVESRGMMCSARELGLGEDHEGLLILADRPEVGTPIAELFEPDTVFELELTANRGDCLSHIGIARELAAYYGRALDLPTIQCPESVEGEGLIAAVEVTSAACPLYTARSIRGVTVGPSPKWLRESLEAIGLRPINNVVDVTNYVLFETGQPLHAFDAAKIDGGRLIVRDAADGETLTTLDDKARTLDARMCVIADAARPLVIAGVMGSVAAEVSEATTDIVLESAYFCPGPVRRATRQLNLFTDSSHRFTRDVDPAGVEYASRRAVDLILEVAGGTLSGPCLSVGERPRGDVTINITGEFVRARTGYDVPDGEIASVFRNLGFTVSNRETHWSVTVPSFRPGVERPVDLVEEFVRLYGTENIPASPVFAPALHREDAPLAVFTRRAVDYLVGQHFAECSHYTLTDADSIAGWDREGAAEALALANPLTSEMSHVRASLVPGLVRAVRLNQSHGNPVARLCESGRIFRHTEGKLWELMSVAFVLPLETGERTWRPSATPDFFTARQLVEAIAALAGVDCSALEWSAERPLPLFHKGHAATAGCYRREGYKLHAGLVNLDFLDACDVDGFVVAGEFMAMPSLFDGLAARSAVRFQPFSEHPVTKKDLAVRVRADTAAAVVQRDLARIADEVTGESFACEAVDLFDVYQDDKLTEQGRKSLAFGLAFRAPDRTLKDKEVNQAFESIQKQMGAAGYEVVR